MNENNMLTHYSVTIQLIDRTGYFEPEILAKSARNAARIALWRLRPELHRKTVALIISAPTDPPAHFPAYDGPPLTIVRNGEQRDLVVAPPSAPNEGQAPAAEQAA
jgi:hypothetical protein